MCLRRQSLRKFIDDHVGDKNIIDLNQLFLDDLTNSVILDVNVFRSLVKFEILAECNDFLIIRSD